MLCGEGDDDVAAGHKPCVPAQKHLICMLSLLEPNVWLLSISSQFNIEANRFLGGGSSTIDPPKVSSSEHLVWCGSFLTTARLSGALSCLDILTPPPPLVFSSSQSLAACHLLRTAQPRRLLSSPTLVGLDMAAAVSFSGAASRLRALPRWSSSVSGDDHAALAMSVAVRPRSARPLRSPAKMMGNVNAGKGLFAPLVVVARNIIGRKRFNQLRGKAIALHSQVITEFCKTIGADSKQRQGLIRLAKKNGEKLGFLA